MFLFSLPTLAQKVQCPSGYICLTQEAANVAAANVKTVTAQANEIQVLKDAVRDKDVSIAQVQAQAAVSAAKLQASIHQTEVDLATKTGQLTRCESDDVRNSAMIEFLVKNQRSKQQGVFNVKLGGN